MMPRIPIPIPIPIPRPRPLPFTIVALAALLAMKSLWLAENWSGSGVAMVAVANAAGPATKTPEASKGPAADAIPPPGRAIPAPPPEPSVPAGPAPVSDSERAVLLELRQRRQELDRRDAAVAARESVLTAAEQKITSRVDEMRGLQKNLETLDAARKEREEASWQGLVKLYQAMKPRDAATIFNDLTMTVLLPLISHMKETKAAPILAAMNPDKARDVTAQLARSRSQLEPVANPPPVPTPANSARPPSNKS